MKEKITDFIFYSIIIIIIVTMIYRGKEFRKYEEQIKLLKQNNIEQNEEKEVYMNRCKMLEDLISENGLVLDNCECK